MQDIEALFFYKSSNIIEDKQSTTRHQQTKDMTDEG